MSFVGTTDGASWYNNFEKYPWEDPSEHLRRSPIMYVGNVKTPTMLMTGVNDLRTPMPQTEQFYSALKLLKVPYRFLYPAILVFCCIGVYSINNNTFDVYVTAAFGLGGYVFMRCGMEGAPLLLGLVLGPMMEENLRRALLLSRGDFSTLVTRPLSAGLLVATVLLLVLVMLPSIKQSREEAFQEA